MHPEGVRWNSQGSRSAKRDDDPWRVTIKHSDPERVRLLPDPFRVA